MATVVPSLKSIAFEYSVYSGDGARPVAMKIYDLSSGTAALVSTIAMTHVFNGTYWGANTFTTAQSGKNFLIQKSVFTDNTYATVDGTYSPGSEIVEVDGFDGNQGRAS